MTRTFGKRAKALLAVLGCIPISTAAQAQDGSAECKISEDDGRGNSITAEILQSKNNEDELLAKYELIVVATQADSVTQSRLNRSQYPQLDLLYYGALGDLPVLTPSLSSVFSYGMFNQRFSYRESVSYAGAVIRDSNSRSSDTDPVIWEAGRDLDSLRTDVTVRYRWAPLSEYSTEATPADMTFKFAREDLIRPQQRARYLMANLEHKQLSGTCTPAKECFLTTATCDVVGLTDDCWELRTLRRFRDDWLMRQPGGREDVATYYSEAPAIVQRLKRNPHALLKVYWTRIIPSALAAQFGANQLARTIYSRMMKELAA